MIFFLMIYSGVAMAIEEPKYSVEKKTEAYEIRKYGAVIIAETKIEASFDSAGNQAFRVLADYIFGNNKSKEKIAMTAPVSQQPASEKIAMTIPVVQAKNADKFLVQFTMPASYTMETLPVPNDPRVQVRLVPERRIVAYTYSGSWSEERYNEKLKVFREALEKDGVVITGEPEFARFNSPLSLWFLRRNEIWYNIPHAESTHEQVK